MPGVIPFGLDTTIWEFQRLQEYDYKIHLERYTAMQMRYHNDQDSLIVSVPSAQPVVTTVASKLPASHDQRKKKDPWSPEVVSQAQKEDPDIGPVINQLLKEWRNQLSDQGAWAKR